VVGQCREGEEIRLPGWYAWTTSTFVLGGDDTAGLAHNMLT